MLIQYHGDADISRCNGAIFFCVLRHNIFLASCIYCAFTILVKHVIVPCQADSNAIFSEFFMQIISENLQ